MASLVCGSVLQKNLKFDMLCLRPQGNLESIDMYLCPKGLGTEDECGNMIMIMDSILSSVVMDQQALS